VKKVGPPFSQDSPETENLEKDTQSSLLFIYQNIMLQSENEVHLSLSEAFQYIKTWLFRMKICPYLKREPLRYNISKLQCVSESYL
jgi:hypothetical protein